MRTAATLFVRQKALYSVLTFWTDPRLICLIAVLENAKLGILLTSCQNCYGIEWLSLVVRITARKGRNFARMALPVVEQQIVPISRSLFIGRLGSKLVVHS